jgi:hypothetical protein
VGGGRSTENPPVTGYALGYYWGYRNNPNCSTLEFQQQLKSSELWTTIRARFAELYGLTFTVDSSGVIQDIRAAAWPELNLRDVYLPLRAARQIDCGSGGLRISDRLYQRLKEHSQELFRYAHAPIWIRLWDLVRTMFEWSPVIDEYVEDQSYYGLGWWQQSPDHTWEPVPANVSLLLSAAITPSPTTIARQKEARTVNAASESPMNVSACPTAAPMGTPQPLRLDVVDNQHAVTGLAPALRLSCCSELPVTTLTRRS